MSRILLLLATTTYRAEDFLAAARRLGIDVAIGVSGSQAAAALVPAATLELDFSDSDAAAHAIVQLAARYPLDAIISAEDDGALIAAKASAALSLPHNSPESVTAVRYKHRMRELLAAAGAPSPGFRVFSVRQDPLAAATEVKFPCVLKPVFLAASRGVIRADDAAEFAAAFRRVAAILEAPDVVRWNDPAADLILVEDFIPGAEVALEGLLTAGELKVLALFDKPDPLAGPYFEETLYVTPSRLSARQQSEVADAVASLAGALGLHHGPVHAELRINGEGIWPIEIAPRSIGGLCSRTVRFGAGISLEELILRHAVGMGTDDLARERQAAGVLMIPIPRTGILREVRGLAAAEAVKGVRGIRITVLPGERLVPLPEGHRYFGFVFASGRTPAEVESALRRAHRRLQPIIEEAPA